jgi:histidine triad (HIT) family protein
MEPAECKFCDLVAGKLRASIVHQDAHSVAFLDHRPLFPGHLLLVPREHVETLDDLPSELVGPFFQTVQLLGRAVQTAMEAHGTFIAINNRISQSVPHLHVHIVPRRKGDGLRGFFWPRCKYLNAAMEQKVAEVIREALRQTQAGG